jgi:hypothetical protein
MGVSPVVAGPASAGHELVPPEEASNPVMRRFYSAVAARALKATELQVRWLHVRNVKFLLHDNINKAHALPKQRY